MMRTPSLLVTDQEILRQLHEAPRQTPLMLLESLTSTDSQQYVQNRLKHLRENNLVHRPGHGIYELTGRGKRALTHLDEYNGNRNAFWAYVTGDDAGSR